MTRLAKAMSAFTPGRSGSTDGRIARSFAGRGAFDGADGSGAPSGRVCVGVLALSLVALGLLVLAPTAFAGKIVDRIVAGSTGTGIAGGLFNTPRDIAVNHTGAGAADAGDVYVVDSANHRIQQFDAEDNFIRAFGQDVIGINEQQTVTVNATGGTYTLTFNGQTTTNIAWNASSATVDNALDVLSSIGGDANVAVSGGSTAPKTVTFTGTLAGTNVPEMTASGAGLTGGASTVAIATVVNGAGGNFAGFEECTDPAICKPGITSAQTGGAMNEPQGIDIDQSDGSLYVTDQGNRRVQKFSADGTFLAAWGWDVTTGGVTVFEICTVASECKAGASGGGEGGRFNFTLGHPVIDPSTGNVLIADAANRRIQEFEANGEWVRAWGWDVVQPGGTGEQTGPPSSEQQTVRLAAEFEFGDVLSGTFTLTFDGQTTPAIPFNASAAAVDAALEALSTVGAGNVNVTGPSAGPWTVDFTGALGAINVPQISGNGAGLTTQFGLAGQVVVTTTVPGGPPPRFEVCVVMTECKSGASSLPANEDGAFGEGQPVHLTVDSGGTIYASDSAASNRVQRFDSTQAAAADLLLPSIAVSALTGTTNTPTTGLEIDSTTDNLLVARSAAVGVLELSDPDGTPDDADRHYQGSGLAPNGIAIDGTGEDLYLSSSTGGHRLFVADDDGATPAIVTIDVPTDIEAHSAIFSGTVNPNGPFPVSYRFQFSKNGVTWSDVAPPVNLGSGASPIPVDDQVVGLEANTFYRARLMTQKGLGNSEVASQEVVFLTDGVRPEVTTNYPLHITGDSATLRGQLNPNSQPTTYHFEYGTTTAYGAKAPVPEASANGGLSRFVSEDIVGLQPDTTYHARLVATNSEGTAFGDDMTFVTRSQVAPVDPRAYEMVTPPFKAARSIGQMSGGPRNNPNLGLPSLDGERVAWSTAFFPLDDSVGSPGTGDRRIIERTENGWRWFTMNTLAMVPKDTITSAPRQARQVPYGSSGDFKSLAWNVQAGVSSELIPSDGPVANRFYTRREGTGVSGFHSWVTDAHAQTRRLGIGDERNDRALFNDDGSAMVRWGEYRGLGEDPNTPGDDDPSDEQQLHGSSGGRTIYFQRHSDPDQLPGAPRDLVNGCTGTGPDATLLPSRVGAGSSTDTIGAQPCTEPDNPLATGTATRTDGSSTLTGVATDSGSFEVGQLISGDGIPGGTRITSVGSGALGLSTSVRCGSALGSGRTAQGSPVVTNVLTDCGEFEVGQTVTGVAIPPGTTIVDITEDPETFTNLTLSAAVTAFDSGQGLAVTAPADLDIAARPQHVTSVRGAALGTGDASGNGYYHGPAATGMSDDGGTVFFHSPAGPPGFGSPECTTATGVNTSCPPQLYVRRYGSNGEATVRWISRAQGVGTQRIAELGSGAIFQGASRDGRYVYFKTNSPLLPSDPNGGQSITDSAASNLSWDLYRYELPADIDDDPANGTLLRVSGGPSDSADPGTNGNPPFGDKGMGAALRYHSEDGRRAYFVTTSPIAGADQTPPTGGASEPQGAPGNVTVRNLYLFDDTGNDPVWKFIGAMPYDEPSGNDTRPTFTACATEAGSMNFGLRGRGSIGRGVEHGNCFRGTPDGRYVVFLTEEALTVDDEDNSGDVYLYDADRDELIRVSAPPPGANPYVCAWAPSSGEEPLFCHGDLSFNMTGGVFDPEGAQGELDFARGWAGGRYNNLSVDAQGVVSVYFESQSQLVPEDTNGDYYDVYQWRNGKLSLITPGTSEDDAWFSGNSLDGEDVFFVTGQRIDPREIDDDDLDIYDARVGGGFPYTPPPAPCDVLAHECRSTALATPAPRGTATSGFVGQGNVKPAPSQPCGKGKVRRGKRCVPRATVCRKRSDSAKRRCIRRQKRLSGSSEGRDREAKRSQRRAK